MDGIFDQLITYQILLDLLYENQKYENMLEVFELIKNKQIDGIKFAKNVIVLTYAALYKLVCLYYKIKHFCNTEI